MYVEFGNADALEGYRDPTSDDPDLVRFKPLEGERVTTVVFPDDMSLQEAFSASVTAQSIHMADGSTPSWVESDSDGLQALLVEHFKITKNTRPKTWGKDTGALAAPRPGNAGEDA